MALLVGCALRRRELASLDVETLQQREGRWVLADLEGKGRRVCAVAVPVWVKQDVDAWRAAAGIEKGQPLRSIAKSGKLGESLGDRAVWSVVEHSAKEIGTEHFGVHDLRRTCAKLYRKNCGIWSRSSSCWDTRRSRPPSATSGPSRRSSSPSMTT